MKNFLSPLILAATPSLALAHPGHDHGHWLAEPIHALSVIAVLAVIGAVTYRLRKSEKNTARQNKQQ